MKERIGVIGLGDLGKRLAIQIANAGFQVVSCDVRPVNKETFVSAVDLTLVATTKHRNAIEIVTAAQDVLEQCRLVHWAIPSAELTQLEDIGERNNHIILHDSVMSSSEAAIAGRNDAKQFSIVHCLVNDRNRVLVAGRDPAVLEHFRSIGLAPKSTTPQSHDELLARSQGIVAALVDSGIQSELAVAFSDGNLTPSGEELFKLLRHREHNWTASTVQSILKNPALRDVIGSTPHTAV